MATSWPSIATPSRVRESIYKRQVRTPFEAGYVQTRSASNRARQRFTLVWNGMTSADLSTLQTFFGNNIGGTFEWTYPTIGSTFDGTTFDVRFQDNQIQYNNIPGTNRYQVTVNLEEK